MAAHNKSYTHKKYTCSQYLVLFLTLTQGVLLVNNTQSYCVYAYKRPASIGRLSVVVSATFVVIVPLYKATTYNRNLDEIKKKKQQQQHFN